MAAVYKPLDLKLVEELKAFAELKDKMLLNPNFKYLVDLIEESEDTQKKLHDFKNYQSRLNNTHALELHNSKLNRRAVMQQKKSPEANVNDPMKLMYEFKITSEGFKKKLSLIVNDFFDILTKIFGDNPNNYAPADQALIKSFICFLIIADQPRWGINDNKMSETFMKISVLLKPDPDANSLYKTGLTLKNSIRTWVTSTEVNEFQQQILAMVTSGKPDILGSSLVLSPPPAAKTKVAPTADDDSPSGSLTQIINLDNSSISESRTNIIHSRSASDSVILNANFDGSSSAQFLTGTVPDDKPSVVSAFSTPAKKPAPTPIDQKLAEKLKTLEEQNAKLLQMIQQQKDAYTAEIKQLQEELQKIQKTQQLTDEKLHKTNIALKTEEAINSHTSEVIPISQSKLNSLPASSSFTAIIALLTEISAMPILNPHVNSTANIANNLDSSATSSPTMLPSFEAGCRANNGTGGETSITNSTCRIHSNTSSNTF